MAEPFETTVVGSMPKPPWLYRQSSLDAKGSDHHGEGADGLLSGPKLLEAHQKSLLAFFLYHLLLKKKLWQFKFQEQTNLTMVVLMSLTVVLVRKTPQQT